SSRISRSRGSDRSRFDYPLLPSRRESSRRSRNAFGLSTPFKTLQNGRSGDRLLYGGRFLIVRSVGSWWTRTPPTNRLPLSFNESEPRARRLARCHDAAVG